MKRIFISILCFLIMFASIGCSNKVNNNSNTNNNTTDNVSDRTNNDKNPIAGNSISSLNTADINGNEITASIFSNHKVTMINVWGTFCGICINEMPDLQKIYSEYKGEDFNLIGVVGDIQLGKSPDVAMDIVNQTKIEYTNILVDDVLYKEVINYFSYVPYTIFVDSNGNILETYVAGGKGYDEYKEIIENLLKDMK